MIIDRLISILTYLGITLLSGYAMWEFHQLGNWFIIIGGLIGSLGFLVASKKTLSKDKILSQVLGLIGLSYGVFALQFITFTIPRNRLPSISICTMIIAGFAMIYSGILERKIISTKYTKVLFFVNIFLFILATTIAVFDVIEVKDFLFLLSLMILGLSHLSEVPRERFTNSTTLWIHDFWRRLFSSSLSSTDPINGTDINLMYFLAILNLIFNPISTGVFQIIMYYSFVALFLGSMTVLNNKKKAIITGFWLSLVVVFYSFFTKIDIPKSMLILIGGLACIGLAYALKGLKIYLQSNHNISDYSPEFLHTFKLPNPVIKLNSKEEPPAKGK